MGAVQQMDDTRDVECGGCCANGICRRRESGFVKVRVLQAEGNDDMNFKDGWVKKIVNHDGRKWWDVPKFNYQAWAFAKDYTTYLTKVPKEQEVAGGWEWEKSVGA